MKHVLVVDDEVSITTLLKYNLEQEGLVVEIAFDGEEAVEKAATQQFDFIVLDLMLPKLNGFEVTKELRRRHVDTPILMLTAKDEVVDKIIGLEIGADDYLTKPFSPRELIARMRAVYRRLTPNQTLPPAEDDQVNKVLKVGDLCADPQEYLVTKANEKLKLTKKEFELLVFLMARVNRIIDRQTLMEHIWQEELYDHSRTIDIHISHLREKIEDDPKKPQYLLTIRGFGYKFQEPSK